MTVDNRIEALLSRILNPSDLGHAATPALRDVIRFALGRPSVESNLVAYFPEASAQSLAENFSINPKGSTMPTQNSFITVPQIYSPDAKNGVAATLTLPQYPGRKFEGKLVRTSDAVDPATRTLLAEVDVNNSTGELLPGSYTEVHLHTKNAAPALIVPATGVILDADGLHVATVDENSIAHLVRVTSGRDFGTTIEILTGLKPGQSVISNPPDSLTEGEKVRVVPAHKEPGAAQ